MSTEAIPHSKTNDSPMPAARDDSSRIMDWKDAVESLAGAGGQMPADDKSRRPSSRTGTRSYEELR